jgi:threonyl-tRNA synthetase
MVHRAVLGSLERFMGILIEHHAGAFPLWLAPLQMSVIPIADAHSAYANEVFEKLKKEDFRVDVMPPNETLGARIRQAQTQKTPYMLVVGDKEIEGGQVAVRTRAKGDLGQIPLEDFISKIRDERDKRTA